MRDPYLKVALRTAERAGRLLLRHHRRPKRVMHKGERANLVTDLDRESETMIAGDLRRAFPDHDIVGEEFPRKLTGSPFRWYIDPLDGTVNYVHALPLFSVSVGLVFESRPVAGVVLAPVLNEVFTAERGRGARRNGRPIRVSSQARLGDSLLVTGFPYAEDGRKRQLKYFSRFILATQAVRRLGCASLDFCYVALGSFDGFWEIGLHPWDMAAGHVVVEEAGGLVTGFDGRTADLERGSIVASNGRVHRAMLRLIARV